MAVTKPATKKQANGKAANGNSGTELGFEATLWQGADKLRNNMDAAEYKHVMLGLIFLKYISDAFDERREELEKEVSAGADPEDADEYRAVNVFWVPKEARWASLQEKAKQPSIGTLVDEAMLAIERDNRSLKGVLPKDYSRPGLDKQRLGELIDLISNIGLGQKDNKSKDVLGRVYEYFLGQFASAEGKKGGQFYTPGCVVRLLVQMIEPYKGRVYDPCCGSGGMFVQSEKFVESHGGKLGDISVYGQESNPTTWRLARMNLAIRGIDANLGPEPADTFTKDLHKDLKADFILANPPFNDSDWKGEQLKQDVRWQYGVPPTNNANYGWIQHFLFHLAPNGIAGFVLANGALSATGAQGDIRKKIINSDLVDCVVSLTPKLFYNFQGPASLWFLSRNKKKLGQWRDRTREVLFIDARKLFVKAGPKNNELTDEHIARISNTYHAWKSGGDYSDQIGYCRSVSVDEIAGCDYSLVPARYTGILVDPPTPHVTRMELAAVDTKIRETLGELESLVERIHTALELASEDD